MSMDPNNIDPSKIEKIIDKVEKMLRLANNAGTEEEATTAMNMAQEYLAAYNLSLADVDITRGQGARPEAARVKEKTQKVALYKWQRHLWKAIAEANFCYYRISTEYHYNKKNQYVPKTFHHYLIGSEANVITVRLMGEYLEQALSRICPYKPGRDSSRSWNSWKEGCAARLGERLAQKKAEMLAENRRKADEAAKANTSTAIALADVFQREDDLNYREMCGEEAYQARLCYRNHTEGQWVEGCAKCKVRKEFAERAPVIYEEAKPAKPETDAQRRKREEKEARDWQRYQEKQARANERHWAKRDLGAYYEGQDAGDKIGLNTQVGTSEQKKLN